jgi:DNA mismatch repair protein PMS2
MSERESAGIRRLSRGAVEKMLARQALPSLSAIVKELVENSLDSGSGSVRVGVREFGVDWVEVADRGAGIALDSLKLMCAFGGTSKIDEYADLHDNVEGFGFRGEGLAAIRVVSDIEVTSRARGQDKGYKAVYTAETEEPVITEVECPEGTTVKVMAPFFRDKVRRDDLVKSAKLTFRQIAETVQTYALIRADTQFELHNFTGGRNNTVFSYLKTSTVLGRLRDVMGLNFEIGACEREASEVKLKIYLSNTVQSGSLKVSSVKKSDLRMAVNLKPADPPSFIRSTVDKIYTEYNPQGKYFVFLMLEVPPAWVDFNLSKDKREILLKNKELICKTISEAIEGHLKESQGAKFVRMSRPAGRESNEPGNLEKEGNNRPSLFDFSDFKLKSPFTQTPMMSVSKEIADENQTPNTERQEIFSKSINLNLPDADSFQDDEDQIQKNEQKEIYVNIEEANILKTLPNKGINTSFFDRLKDKKASSPQKTQLLSSQTSRPIYLDRPLSEPNSEQISRRSSERPSLVQTHDHIEDITSTLTLKEYYGNKPREVPDFGALEFKKPTKKILTKDGSVSISANVQVEEEKGCCLDQPGSERLDVEVSASDKLRQSLLVRIKAEDLSGDNEKFVQKNFAELQVLGQFNKGFIICKWKESDGRYFVVDQHAADEKANYEKLKKDLKVSTQALISPMVIDLSLTDYMVVEQNKSIFEENGFKIKLESIEEKNQHKVLIVGVPNVFYWRYDKSDFMDLLYIVANHARIFEDLMVPKAKREIATKACRSSIKIGDPLEVSTMKEIVSRLSILKHPWNCPHGRPSTIIAERIREPKLDRKLLKESLRTII